MSNRLRHYFLGLWSLVLLLVGLIGPLVLLVLHFTGVVTVTLSPVVLALVWINYGVFVVHVCSSSAHTLDK